MPKMISADLPAFTQAINDGKRVVCNRKGEWSLENGFTRFVKQIFCWKDTRALRVADAFNRVLDQLERIPVQFSDNSEVAEQHKGKFAQYFSAYEAVKNKLRKEKGKAAAHKLAEMDLRVASLKYRIEEMNGGLRQSLEINQEDLDKIAELAREWKGSYELYKDKSLFPAEVQKLKELCAFPDFTRVLLLDKPLREQFFKSALRDNYPVDAFVQFPSVFQRLKTAFLAGRINRFSPTEMVKYRPLDKSESSEKFTYLPIGLSEKTTVSLEKHIVLPFEVQNESEESVEEFSLLEESAVVNTKHNWKRTVGQIVQNFAGRNLKPGDFEYFGGCVTASGKVLGPRIASWNSVELGSYNPATLSYEGVDLTAENWWQKIPPINTRTIDLIQKEYGLKTLPKQGEWIAAVRASKEDAGLDVDRSHGFLDILIPMDEEGKLFNIYPLGKYAAPEEWPMSCFKKVGFITNTVKAKVSCPDENVLFPHRQQAIAPRVLKPQEAIELMGLIRQDLIKSKEGNIVFQFPWENCAWWSQALLENVLEGKEGYEPVPNYFRTPLLYARPKIVFLDYIFRFCRSLSGKLQKLAVKITEFILGAFRGISVVENGRKVYKSVVNSPHWKNLEIYLPSYLHELIFKGEVEGVVTFGNLALKQS